MAVVELRVVPAARADLHRGLTAHRRALGPSPCDGCCWRQLRTELGRVAQEDLACIRLSDRGGRAILGIQKQLHGGTTITHHVALESVRDHEHQLHLTPHERVVAQRDGA